MQNQTGQIQKDGVKLLLHWDNFDFLRVSIFWEVLKWSCNHHKLTFFKICHGTSLCPLWTNMTKMSKGIDQSLWHVSFTLEVEFEFTTWAWVQATTGTAMGSGCFYLYVNVYIYILFISKRVWGQYGRAHFSKNSVSLEQIEIFQFCLKIQCL